MRKLLLGLSLMICLVLSTSFLVSSNSNFSGPPNPVPQKQDTGNSALRAIYDDDDAFNQLSGAGRTRLELMFGRKAEKSGKDGSRSSAKSQRLNPTEIPQSGSSLSIDDEIAPLAAPVTRLVSNPATDATAQNTQNETTIALAANGNVIASWNDSGSFIGGANKFTGIGVSTNGGTTFTDLGTLPNTTTPLIGDVGDPLLAVDRTTGRVYLATLAFTGTGIQIFRSTDNGLTYGQPSNAFPGFPTSGFFDKEWVAVDNASGTGNGNVYVVSRLFDGAANSGIYFNRSTDQGATFPTLANTPNIVTGQQGAYVTVGPDHSVYVFWYDSSAGRRIRMRKSTDLGVTFGATINVSPLLNSVGVNGDLGLTGGFRSNSFPQAVVSQVNGNILYATYNDINVGGTDRGNVFVVASTDAGATWGTPIQINDDSTTTQQYGPVIALTPDGTRLFSGFYDRRRSANGLIDVFGAVYTANTSSGALAPLGSNFRITEQGFPVVVGVDPVINTTYMGDYDQAVADNSFFYLTWGDNRNGNPDVRFSRISVNGPGAILEFANSAIVADTNNNGAIDFTETVSLNVALRNSGTTAAMGINATLSTSTTGVTVTQPTSAYPNIPTSGMATNNTPFVITTSSNLACGSPINFTLNVTTTSDGSFSIPFSVNTGTVGAQQTFTYTGPVVPIPDAGAPVTATINVTAMGAIGDIDFRFDGTSCSATTGSTTVGLDHTFVSDLVIDLISPTGTTVRILNSVDGSGNNFCQTVLDDAAAVQLNAATASTLAPFTGTFRGSNPLSAFNGQMATGTWTLRVQDVAAIDTGNIRAFSLLIRPVSCGVIQAPVLDRANVIVADTVNARLQNTTDNGNSWTVVGTQRFNNAQGVTTNNAGSLIFVAETGSSRILRSTNNGTSFTPIILAGTAPGTVNAPTSVAYDQVNDRLYISDTGNNRIQVLNTASTATTGATVFAGAGAGAGVGQFNQPTGIAVNATGIVYVCDTANNRIQFNPTGAAGGWKIFAGATAGTTLGKVNGPRGIYVNAAGTVFVADTVNNRIMTNVGGSDTLIGTWAQIIGPGVAVGTVNAPQGVVFTSGSFVFTSDSNRIQRFTATGGSPFLSGPAGVAPGQFNGPRGIR